MGSSAQISSGVCRRESQEQVPEEGSRRFRRVLVCGGLGSGSLFRKVPKSSGVCWGKFRRQVPEGPDMSGRFAEGSVEGSAVCAGVGSGGRFWKVPESYGVVCCLATLTEAAM